MKVGAYIDMKSPTWRYKDAPLFKFKIMGCKIEDGVRVVSCWVFGTITLLWCTYNPNSFWI